MLYMCFERTTPNPLHLPYPTTDSTQPQRNLLFRRSSFDLLGSQHCNFIAKGDKIRGVSNDVSDPCGMYFNIWASFHSQGAYYLPLQCPEDPVVSLPSRTTRHKNVSAVYVSALVVWRVCYRWGISTKWSLSILKGRVST